MPEVTLTGLVSNIEGEERALAYLDVNNNNTTYKWEIFIPKNVENINNYLQSVEDSIISDINSKEAIWASLDPKTKTINDPSTGQTIEVPISKEEIVRPSIPDYYVLRRNEYPSLGDQLDAMWKGADSPEFLAMKENISFIKSKYPKY
jgi:hypothetical protein